ncbi:MAG: chromosomal replication initiator protein DnaA [Lachnospiraceae bacterium]|nr:chromosomal replication initiator protein DnaA [Lachnospiraceae bacterium]
MYDLLIEKWDEIVEKLKNEYYCSEVSARTWISPLVIDSVEGNTINLLFTGLSPDMSIKIIKQKYEASLKVIIEEITGTEFNLNFISESSAKSHPVSDAVPDNDLKKHLDDANLNPKYDFDSFIVGSNNNMAYAVALAVAESPGNIYNPLFIYGGVGLGKTHLMQAIGNFLINNNPELKVLYTASESFTNELIDILRSGNKGNKDNTDFTNFRNKYRNVDVLMIDDIQFIIGKDRTQEEFFHTFNELYMNGKQIIITSDKPPKDMTLLEERFRSRFAEGITVDIQSPDYETRMAILERNSELNNYKIDEQVLKYIADNIVSNVRELEGALKKIILYSSFSKQEISLSLAQEVLKDIISPDESNINITCERILDIVAEHQDISVTDLLSPKRTKDIAYARQIYMYLARKLTDKTDSDIGSVVNRSDHSTVIHGVKKIQKEIDTNPSLKNTIDILIKKISPK